MEEFKVFEIGLKEVLELKEVSGVKGAYLPQNSWFNRFTQGKPGLSVILVEQQRLTSDNLSCTILDIHRVTDMQGPHLQTFTQS